MQNRTHPDRPWVGVGVVIWKGDDVLLVKRAKPPRADEWGLPGGAQAAGETIFDAARREILEETGLTVAPQTVLTALDAINRDPDSRVLYHYTLVEVMATYESGELKLSDELTEASWFPYEKALEAVSWDEARKILEIAHTTRQMMGDYAATQ